MKIKIDAELCCPSEEGERRAEIYKPEKEEK